VVLGTFPSREDPGRHRARADKLTHNAVEPFSIEEMIEAILWRHQNGAKPQKFTGAPLGLRKWPNLLAGNWWLARLGRRRF
jgi:hypothetical protein